MSFLTTVFCVLGCLVLILVGFFCSYAYDYWWDKGFKLPPDPAYIGGGEACVCGGELARSANHSVCYDCTRVEGHNDSN